MAALHLLPPPHGVGQRAAKHNQTLMNWQWVEEAAQHILGEKGVQWVLQSPQGKQGSCLATKAFSFCLCLEFWGLACLERESHAEVPW